MAGCSGMASVTDFPGPRLMPSSYLSIGHLSLSSKGQPQGEEN